MSSTEEHVTFGLPVSWRHPLRKLLVKSLWPNIRQQVKFNREIAAESEQALRSVNVLNERVEDALSGHHSALVRHDEVLARFDRERSGFEEGVNDRIEYLQRQAFARYHDATGALRRDLAETAQQFSEVTSAISGDLAGHAREVALTLKRLDAQIEDGIAELRLEQRSQILSVRDEVAAAREQLDSAIAEQRVRLGALEMFLATLRRSLPELPKKEDLAAIPNEVILFMNSLEDAVSPAPAIVRERLARYLDEVRVASHFGPVLELDPKNCEWLRMLHEEHIASYGVALSLPRIDDGRRYGVEIRHEAVAAHLRDVAPGSLGAICAFGLFDRLEPNEIIEVLDLSMRALHADGVLVAEGLDPAAVIASAPAVYTLGANRLPISYPVLSYFLSARGFVNLVAVSGAPSTVPIGEPSINDVNRVGALDSIESNSAAPYYAIVARHP